MPQLRLFFRNLDIFFHIKNRKSALLLFENFWDDFLISSYFRKIYMYQIVSDMFSSKLVHKNLNVTRKCIILFRAEFIAVLDRELDSPDLR